MIFFTSQIKHQTEKAYLLSKTSGPFHEVRTHNGQTRVFKIYNVTEGWVPKSQCTVKGSRIEVPEQFAPKQTERLI